MAGMATGADSIEDLDVIRHGGMKRLFARHRLHTRPSPEGGHSNRHGHRATATKPDRADMKLSNIGRAATQHDSG